MKSRTSTGYFSTSICSSATQLSCINQLHQLSVSRVDFRTLSVQNPHVSKSNRLQHAAMFRVSFIILKHIPYIPPKRCIILMKSRTSTDSFSNSICSSVTRLSCSNQLRQSSVSGVDFRKCSVKNPCFSKSNRIQHAAMFWFSFIDLKHIP